LTATEAWLAARDSASDVAGDMLGALAKPCAVRARTAAIATCRGKWQDADKAGEIRSLNPDDAPGHIRL